MFLFFTVPLILDEGMEKKMQNKRTEPKQGYALRGVPEGESSCVNS